MADGSAPDASDAAAALQTFMALDFGAKRTGVAFASRMLGHARPLATIRAEAAQARLAQVKVRLLEWQPQALVVGIPLPVSYTHLTLPTNREV